MRLEQIIRSLQTLQTRLQTHSFPAPYYVMNRIGKRWFTKEELKNASRDLLNNTAPRIPRRLGAGLAGKL